MANRYNSDVNPSKGEYYCVKANVGCPVGFSGSMDQQNGKLTCTPVITADRGTSNTMQPRPDDPGAMFSVPGNDWHSEALSTDDW